MNGGFESSVPAALVPEAAARILLPGYPEGTRPVRGQAATGEEEFRALDLPAETRVLAPDREGPTTPCVLYASPGADEILVSDTGIDALGVEIVSFGRGLWRFAGETIVRPSEPPQVW